MTVLAYLAPEIPALSATFVYEELLGLERRGFTIVPVSIRAPASPASGMAALCQRTAVLYDAPAPRLAMRGLAAAASFRGRIFRPLGWLLRDMASVGPWRKQAWKLGYQWLMGANLARLLVRRGCTHLHVHFAHTPAQVAMYASAFSGIPFTVTAHANDIFERPLLLPRKARRAWKMLTISQFNVDHLRRIGVPAAKLAVVRCGVSFSARADRPLFEHRERYRVGTLCRLVEKKGIDDLIRATALLREAPWQLELSVAGDGPMLQSLKALAVELGVADRVRFEGALAHQAVTDWLHSLDVFALPCKTDARGDMDGIPVALMEAMSQRVPVVSTRISGIPELVVHERTGLLAEPANPPSLARELGRLLDDPTLRQRLSDAAVQHVELEFGQAQNLDRLMRHFTPEAQAEAHLRVV